jgi:hypothetical protein
VTAWLLTIHSLVRWLILVAGAVAIVRAGWGWIGTLDFVRPDSVLDAVFTGLLDLNVVLGIVLLIDRWGSLDRSAEIHPLIMILAAVVAHAARMVGRERADRSRHLIQGGGFLLSLLLVVLGIQFVT